MITERELLDAIKECEKEPITMAKCDKLASFYIIYDHLFGNGGYSFGQGKTEVEKVITTNGDSEFLRMIDGMKSERVLKVVDELMETIKLINPKLYDGVLRKLDD